MEKKSIWWDIILPVGIAVLCAILGSYIMSNHIVEESQKEFVEYQKVINHRIDSLSREIVIAQQRRDTTLVTPIFNPTINITIP